MKPLEQLPTEFKRDDKTQGAAGRYLIPHPLIKRYFFDVTIMIQGTVETAKIKLICLVSANKGIFKSISRYPTFYDSLMIKELFWNPGELMIQELAENLEETSKGDFFIHLIKSDEQKN